MAAPESGQELEISGEAGIVLNGAEGGAVHDFEGGGAGVLEVFNGGAGGVEVGEEEQRCRLVGVVGDSAQDSFCDEGEGAFGADEQVAEDVDGALVVEEGVEGVAGGVLGLVLLADAGGECGAGFDFGLEVKESGAEGGLEEAEEVVGVGVGGVDLGAGGEDEGEGLEGVIGVLDDAAAHAAGVVGEDAAHTATGDGGGVGADLLAIEAEGVVGVLTDDAGLKTDGVPVLLNADGAPVSGDVDQDAIGDRLA
jgi:hypothetical protein